MNIRTLFLVISLSLSTSLNELMAVTVIDQFKQGLYTVQKGFIKEDKLNRLMEPYLQEMERSLHCFRYFKHNPTVDSAVRRNYFRDLFQYYVACFYDFVRNKSETRDGTNLWASDLRGQIQWLEQIGILQGCTWQEEYQKTADILHRMAVAYYDALPRRKKLKIWWLKLTTLIEFRGLSFIPGNESFEQF